MTADMTFNETLLKKIRLLTWFFMMGLFLSGVTAIPLHSELQLLHKMVANGAVARGFVPTGFAEWILKVEQGLSSTNAKYPFLAYGTDWLAFGHIVITIAFWGAVKDPIRNRWLYDFGLIACALIIPWALVLGQVRDIPLGWRLIDCSFGVFGAIPLLIIRHWLSQMNLQAPGL
ncbi:MAG: hypothetical protein JWN25_2839 [Verrucomicrobiales bacterium]|nr:hypothetical protein [Verrucomicrobiales bacterium]